MREDTVGGVCGGRVCVVGVGGVVGGGEWWEGTLQQSFTSSVPHRVNLLGQFSLERE